MIVWDSLWIDGAVATLSGSEPFGLIANGAVGIEGDRIAWVGPVADLPGPPEALARHVEHFAGRVLTPGLVDCHTHVVYAGDGLADFEVLTQGGGRGDLERVGGGVQGMVKRTRAASDAELYEQSADRVVRLITAGVTTLESKSGAGLDLDTELRQMRVSRELGRRLPVTVVSTFLGAHGLPSEYTDRRDAYVEFLCDVVLPAAVNEGLVDAVDGFCDKVGFSREQIGRLFDRASELGLPVKLHADQYTDFGAGAVVAKYRGLSADHLEYASEATVRAMAAAGTVATLLPGAHWLLGETQRPPVGLFRQHGVAMALATNCNPVSSPTTSPSLMMHMACRLFGLTTAEALAAFTVNGAKALGFDDRGTIAVGGRADLAVWDVTRPGELAYRIGDNRCRVVVRGGDVVHRFETSDLTRESDNSGGSK